MLKRKWFVGFMLTGVLAGWAQAQPTIDLGNATVVVRSGKVPLVEQTAATVLVEEVEKRTGIRWPVSTTWPKVGKAIAVLSGTSNTLKGKHVPTKGAITAKEGFAIATEGDVIWIAGVDPKGALNGVGKLLRQLEWGKGAVGLTAALNAVESPELPIRGHQLGYRTTANSYDAWTPEQYEQYIRELALFGVNAVENIPFQDDESPLMPVSRQEMNKRLGTICEKYGVAYWVWTPATVDLTDAAKRAAHLQEHEGFYKECTHLDAVFFPGGDPGNNHPQDVMPFLEDVSKLLKKHHPHAKVWMSLQGFDDPEVDYFFDWITKNQPTWFGGAVGGPSSKPLPELRARLPKQYQLRDYPDITHTVRAQYPAPWLDPAFAFTSGREGTNPQPVYFSTLFRAFAKSTDGFISYSDGMHDDVNKTIFSALGWDYDADVRDVLIEYCRVFFGPHVAVKAADGIYALERNWHGSLADNGGVEATLTHWQGLEAAAPELKGNWRWQLCLLKANYDAYVRARLIREDRLEKQANAVLLSDLAGGADSRMEQALAVFAQADSNNPRPELRAKVETLCEELFKSIGYQSSVEKYKANNPQRSAVLDFVDHPLNNRWWYEDQFAEIRKLETEEAKLERLKTIATWENPGPGSLYDDIGNVAQSDRVLRGEAVSTDPLMRRNPNPDFMWWDEGKTRVRQSWIGKMDWPIGLRYDNLDTAATYVLRTTGLAQCLPRVNGTLITPTLDGKGIGEIKEFPIPQALYESGTIVLTFDVPHEPGVNWRQASRLSEVWLIKK
ncbi:MAG: hypothetical protein AMXMBFR84_47080 [Candidatus Hydrogenedentota bacterium]